MPPSAHLDVLCVPLLHLHAFLAIAYHQKSCMEWALWASWALVPLSFSHVHVREFRAPGSPMVVLEASKLAKHICPFEFLASKGVCKTLWTAFQTQAIMKPSSHGKGHLLVSLSKRRYLMASFAMERREWSTISVLHIGQSHTSYEVRRSREI